MVTSGIGGDYAGNIQARVFLQKDILNIKFLWFIYNVYIISGQHEYTQFKSIFILQVGYHRWSLDLTLVRNNIPLNISCIVLFCFVFFYSTCGDLQTVFFVLQTLQYKLTCVFYFYYQLPKKPISEPQASYVYLIIKIAILAETIEEQVITI